MELRPQLHHAAEQVPGDLVGAQPPLAAERARDAVLVLEPVDPALHTGLNLAVPDEPPSALSLLGQFLLVQLHHVRDGLHVALGEAFAPGAGPLLAASVLVDWPWNSGKTRWAMSS